MLNIPNIPTPSFDEPLQLLRACHMKMLMNCSTMEKLAAHIKTKGVDTEAKDAAQTIRRYFNDAAPLHHQDEEQDLFPLLLTISANFEAIINLLDGEHDELEEGWEILNEMLADLDKIEDLDAFAELVQIFGQTYRDHIKVEEEQLLMPIDGQLNDEQLSQLGKAMAARRTQP